MVLACLSPISDQAAHIEKGVCETGVGQGSLALLLYPIRDRCDHSLPLFDQPRHSEMVPGGRGGRHIPSMGEMDRGEIISMVRPMDPNRPSLPSAYISDPDIPSTVACLPRISDDKKSVYANLLEVSAGMC